MDRDRGVGVVTGQELKRGSMTGDVHLDRETIRLLRRASMMAEIILPEGWLFRGIAEELRDRLTAALEEGGPDVR